MQDQAHKEPMQPLCWIDNESIIKLKKSTGVLTALTKHKGFPRNIALYTDLPAQCADWVDLTVEDEKQIYDEAEGSVSWSIKLTIAKLREKNGF